VAAMEVRRLAEGLRGLAMSDRRKIVTETLIRHGHYSDYTEDPTDVEWMRVDAERVLQGPLTYEGIAAALIDTALHDPEECNVVCVSDLLEALSP
jgi:hypothetical protein